MVSLSRLKASGLTEEKLKAYFTNVQAGSQAEKLVQHIRDCIKSGVDRNLRDYRIYWAIDRSYDTPFYQVSYTQLQGLMDGKTFDTKESQQKVLDQANQWGLSHLLANTYNKDGSICCDAGGKPVKAVNLPIFHHIFIPLVCAIVTIRWAKLFNDVNLTPLYKYEPARFTRVNRLRCEIITELVSIIATNYNYRDDERQAILQMLLYGFCVKMPREAWHQELQEDADGQEVIVKEGLRFHMPHPSRFYQDLFYRPSSLNSDTGCRYLGYWEIRPYEEVKANPKYWNTDKISYGVQSWFTAPGWNDFFSLVYPCTLKWPVVNTLGSTSGAGALDRENDAAFYGGNDGHASTLCTEHCQKLIPADWGLGTYKYPVWMRFVMANDSAVLWAEPTGFTPGAFYGYDFDGNRSRNRSLALEVLPFQDLLGQTISQWILSIRQNLINPTFVNEDLVPQEVINQLQNMGERMLRTRTFIPFSKTENIQLGDDERQAFYSPPLTHHNTAELAGMVKGIIDILDRVLVLSSQEIGQTAPHEQTAEEVRTTRQTTSTRLDFTGSFRDEGIYATKKMVYDALMAHGDDHFSVSISQSYAPTEEDFKKLLETVGLDLEAGGEERSADGKRLVTGSKEALALELFASTRDASNRIDSPSVAAAMSQIFQAVAGNPLLIQTVGAEQLVDLLNLVISVAGLPKDFKLRAVNTQLPQEQQAQQMQQQFVEFANKVKQAIDASAKETTDAVLGQTAKALEGVGQSVQHIALENEAQAKQITELQQAVGKVAQMLSAAAQAPALPQQPPPPQFLQPPPNENPNDIMGAAEIGAPPPIAGVS